MSLLAIPLSAYMLPTIDELADIWRWWAAMGSAMALGPLVNCLIGMIRSRTFATFGWRAGIYLGTAYLCAIVAVLLAGFIIPFATDGRVAGITTQSLLYRQGIAAAWLLWGACTWLTAMGLARHSWRMAAASVLWWWAMFVATRATEGAQMFAL